MIRINLLSEARPAAQEEGRLRAGRRRAAQHAPHGGRDRARGSHRHRPLLGPSFADQGPGREDPDRPGRGRAPRGRPQGSEGLRGEEGPRPAQGRPHQPAQAEPARPGAPHGRGLEGAARTSSGSSGWNTTGTRSRSTARPSTRPRWRTSSRTSSSCPRSRSRRWNSRRAAAPTGSSLYCFKTNFGFSNIDRTQPGRAAPSRRSRAGRAAEEGRAGDPANAAAAPAPREV